MKVFYTAQAITKGGRNGHSETADRSIKLDMALQKELGGSGKAGANPEQLFAMGYSACFGSALEYVAQMQKKPIKDLEVTAKVGIGPKEGGGFKLNAALEVHLPGIPQAEAEALVAEAHKVCPYSNATRNNIDVTLKVI